MTDFLLQEIADYLLQETADKIILDVTTTSTSTTSTSSSTTSTSSSTTSTSSSTTTTSTSVPYLKFKVESNIALLPINVEKDQISNFSIESGTDVLQLDVGLVK